MICILAIEALRGREISVTVTVTATDLFSASLLPSLLTPLRDAARGIFVRIVASSDIENLMQRDADIAVRHVRPDQPDLIAKHVEKVLPSLSSVQFPIWLVTHRELQTSRRIRLVFDRLSQGIRDALMQAP